MITVIGRNRIISVRLRRLQSCGGDSELLASDDLAVRLRLAAEDLKSCYFEALSAQPNQPTNASSLADWFWGETLAAAVINEVRKKCLQQGTREMDLAGSLLLVPRNQMHRFEQ